MTARDHKMNWDLPETLRWIITRDEEWISPMADIAEKNGTPLTIFPAKAVLDAHALWALVKIDFMDDFDPSARQASRKSFDANESGMIAPSQALNFLLQLMHSRHVRITAIKCDRYRVKQVPVAPAELDDLEFRITPDHRLAKVGLWSRSHNTLMWRSPLFLRSDIMRVWPARRKKSAAVSGAILLHLQTITSAAAPLTRAEAQQRCLGEVHDAYPAAFKNAWAILDPSCKRERARGDAKTH